jgi:hypothetical protein
MVLIAVLCPHCQRDQASKGARPMGPEGWREKPVWANPLP